MRQLEAGRELDVLVAETVMGWSKAVPQEWMKNPPPSEWAISPRGWYENPPAYSTDIARAWEVVRHVCINFSAGCLNLRLVEYAYARTYAHFGLAEPEDSDYSEGTGDHCTPVAICLAAIKAVGAWRLTDALANADECVEHMTWCRHCGEDNPAECPHNGDNYRAWQARRALSGGTRKENGA